MDSIPHTENELRWLIFAGDIPTHLERGRLPALPVHELDAATTSDDRVGMLNERQIDGARISS